MLWKSRINFGIVTIYSYLALAGKFKASKLARTEISNGEKEVCPYKEQNKIKSQEEIADSSSTSQKKIERFTADDMLKLILVAVVGKLVYIVPTF